MFQLSNLRSIEFKHRSRIKFHMRKWMGFIGAGRGPCLQDFLVGSSNDETQPFSDWLVHTCNASTTGVYSWWAV